MSRLASALPWIVAFVTLSQLPRPVPVHATPCPNLAFLVDRSNSMLNTMAGTPPMAGELSRWQVVRGALATALAQYDDKLPIGLALFPAPGSTCSTSSFVTIPTYGSQAAILATLDAADSLPGSMALTPTCGAVNALAADSALRDASRAQYIVLITDGKPLCQSSAGCTCDACSSLGAVNAAVESLRQARSQSPSIHTFVVGLGGSLDATEKQILNDMAAEGGEANPDPSVDYYPADTAAALSSQLAVILRTVAGTGVSGGGSLACDDSCYSAGCPMGNACVQAVCRSNPCSSLRCDSGQYCYF
ncbi:MAG TPA: vWA domain-containing protein, partial [Pseudomonadota bacterium]|nr:vWA domain-containing protein [Pseudomonadota bacterium]